MDITFRNARVLLNCGSGMCYTPQRERESNELSTKFDLETSIFGYTEKS